MKMNLSLLKKTLVLFVSVLFFSACNAALVGNMPASKMNQLELGMSKEQVIKVLGKQYTISEKRKENGIEIEVFSYRDLYFPNEFYLFSFVDNKLEKWHKETQPTYEVKTNKQ